MNPLQNYLRNGGTIDELLSKYAIKAKRHPKYPQLVQFKYNQIESPMGDPIVQSARGIIMDENDSWKIIAYPFNKFFNYGEIHAAAIDWSTARVQEKLDGSLMILYHYDNQWHVATSGMPDAGGEVNGCGFTFAELFWRVWKELSLHHPNDPCYIQEVTYIFELMTPFNRVVVRHKKNDLKAIGARNRMTGQEYSVDQEESLNLDWSALPEPVRSFPLQSTDDILNTFVKMDPLVQEGYVVVDGNFNRIKVKHPGYVTIHHMRDGFGPRRMLEVVRSGEASELLTHFPEWTDVYDEVSLKFNELVKRLEDAYETHRNEITQKDFAMKVKDLPYSGALFSLRTGKVTSIRQFLKEINIKSLADGLNLKDIEF